MDAIVARAAQPVAPTAVADPNANVNATAQVAGAVAQAAVINSAARSGFGGFLRVHLFGLSSKLLFALFCCLAACLKPINTTFGVEVNPPQGGVLLIERTTPARIDTVTDLH